MVISVRERGRQSAWPSGGPGTGVGGPMVVEVMSLEVALRAGGARRAVCRGRATGGVVGPPPSPGFSSRRGLPSQGKRRRDFCLTSCG